MVEQQDLHLVELGMEIGKLKVLLGITCEAPVSFAEPGLAVRTEFVASAVAEGRDGKAGHSIQYEAPTMPLAVLGCANAKLAADREYREKA